MKDRSEAAHVKAAKCVCGHAFSRHTFLPDIQINYGTCMDCEACSGFSVRLALKVPDLPLSKALLDADRASRSVCPDPGNVSTPPTWGDVVRLSNHYPQVKSALTMWRANALTKEQALIAACFGLARSLSLMHADVVDRLSKVEANVDFIERAAQLKRQGQPTDADLTRLGPPRWKCKRCGKERRSGECLHCGNTEPITDEPVVPGAAW